MNSRIQGHIADELPRGAGRREPARSAPVRSHSSNSARADDDSTAPSSIDTTAPIALGHLLKAIAVALALTGLFMSPQLLIHIPTGIIAPISAGYTTGGLMRVTGREAVILGVTLFLVIGLPVPIAYHAFGLFDHLPFVAIAVFSGVAATYYGVLIGIMSWIGGGGLQRAQRRTTGLSMPMDSDRSQSG